MVHRGSSADDEIGRRDVDDDDSYQDHDGDIQTVVAPKRVSGLEPFKIVRVGILKTSFQMMRRVSVNIETDDFVEEINRQFDALNGLRVRVTVEEVRG